MSNATFENTSNLRRTLGGGGSQITLAPGETQIFDTDNYLADTEVRLCALAALRFRT